MKTYNTLIKEKILTVEDGPGQFLKAKLTNSTDAFKYAINFYKSDLFIYESFYTIYTNRANNVIGYAKISQGGIKGTVVDSIIIIKYAIELLASTILLIHNHPSGNLKPSSSDIAITKKVNEAAQLMDMKVLDHLIIAESNYFSFKDDGLI